MPPNSILETRTPGIKITIVGATGLVDRKLVDRLRQAGHEVRGAARSTGVDLISGEGLAQALKGANVPVDVSSPGYAEADDMQRFFETAGAHLSLRRAHGWGRSSYCPFGDRPGGLSGNGYFRAKMAQEAAVTGSGVPFTIVRSTPFFEFVYNIVDAGEDADVSRLRP